MPKHILTKEQEQYIIDQHLKNNRSITDIARDFNYTSKVIKRILKKYNVEPTSHLIKYQNIKIDIFEKIDSAEKAYWIGFISEDGFINKKGIYLKIKLQISDINHLYKFCNFINMPYDSVKIEHHNITNKELCSITVSRKKIVNDLISLGITNNKNCGREKVIDIPEQYMKDYIRGVIDANGNINSKNINIISSQQVLRHINDFLSKTYGIKQLNILDHCNTYRIYICKDRSKVLKDIYYDNCTCLDRKYDIVKSVYLYT